MNTFIPKSLSDNTVICACGTDADRRAGVVLRASFFIDGHFHPLVQLPSLTRI
ncbi:hypothetical protein REC12_23520 [Desulfosporosinus sp. PR]|uniref:hypothetical protein n=1 Tax=Candidatus Desulfosporosinus nitrosoreducens TaxID=3401928 RepID=UPI0027EE0421|nr:hypothetical protein [Desulfosporosinus sp. PR]MDQ7096569.1 hypothetical protein [Desulfosporosinus sp. PR]